MWDQSDPGRTQLGGLAKFDDLGLYRYWGTVRRGMWPW